MSTFLFYLGHSLFGVLKGFSGSYTNIISENQNKCVVIGVVFWIVVIFAGSLTVRFFNETNKTPGAKPVQKDNPYKTYNKVFALCIEGKTLDSSLMPAIRDEFGPEAPDLVPLVFNLKQTNQTVNKLPLRFSKHYVPFDLDTLAGKLTVEEAQSKFSKIRPEVKEYQFLGGQKRLLFIGSKHIGKRGQKFQGSASQESISEVTGVIKDAFKRKKIDYVIVEGLKQNKGVVPCRWGLLSSFMKSEDAVIDKGGRGVIYGLQCPYEWYTLPRF